MKRMKMTYIKKEEREKFEPLLKKLYDLNIKYKSEIIYILFHYCKSCIKPEYNNYKNYIGELYLCSIEIKRRFFLNTSLESNHEYIIISNNRMLELNEIVKYMNSFGIKVDGDLNYILYKFCKCNIINKYDFYCALVITGQKIIKGLLTNYEKVMIQTNGDI